MKENQLTFFEINEEGPLSNTSTFVNNMTLPVHRWFRYSAGFSAKWVEKVITDFKKNQSEINVLDPYAGSGTTIIVAEDLGVKSIGLEAHPFIFRVAKAKLFRNSDSILYSRFSSQVLALAKNLQNPAIGYPDLIQRCYTNEHLDALHCLRLAYEELADGTPASDLT